MIFKWLQGLTIAGVLTACVSTEAEQAVEPGYEPALTSTEAGLWMTMDRFEKRLANSELVERDPELNGYVRKVLCNVTPKHCNDIRVFIIKNPYFNATMAPNGSMHVWTGLLLRVQNEDQLAAVLGHEMAHYLHRHSLRQWNTTKATMEFLTFFSIATGGIGGGLIGLAATIGAAGALQSYSQEFEHEADSEGLELTSAAGYDPSEVIAMWELVKAEKDAAKDTANAFWQTHPPTVERIERLKLKVSSLPASITAPPQSMSKFEILYKAHWHKWAHNLVTVSSPDEAIVVLDRLKEGGRNEAEVAYFKGEVLRRKGSQEDLENAKDFYLQAAQVTPAPLKTYKQLALVEKRLGMDAEAREHFQLYLTQNPLARDRKLVQRYLEQLGE